MLAISSGGVLAGIVGALLAVPTVAFFNNAFQVLLAPNPSAEVEAQADEGSTIVEAEPDNVQARSGPDGAEPNGRSDDRSKQRTEDRSES